MAERRLLRPARGDESLASDALDAAGRPLEGHQSLLVPNTTGVSGRSKSLSMIRRTTGPETWLPNPACSTTETTT